MKKKLQWCVIVASLLFLAVFLCRESIAAKLRADVIEVPVVSREEIAELIDGKTQEAFGFAKVWFDEARVPYDKESNTLFIPQNISDAYWQGELTARKKGAKLYFLTDELLGDKEEAIASGHAFTLYYLEDGAYATYQLVFTGMPVMIISGKKDIGAPEDRNWTADMQLYDPYHSASKIQKSKCNYHVRGGSSQHYHKSNFKLELEGKKLSLLGMRVDDDWILNSLYDDAGLIHNKVSTSVWREIANYNNVPNDEGMTQEYVELFLGTRYVGVYTLGERVDQTTLSLKDEDILYKCRADRIPEEHNYTNENTDEMRPIFVLKYPKEPSAEDWNPLKDWVNYFCKDRLTSYEQGKALLNMENSVDYNLFTLLICGVDNIRKNVFLVAEYQGDGTYQFKKVPWDMNATWGNPWVYDATCNYTIYDPSYIENMSTWPTDMDTLYDYGEAEMSVLLRDRWKELRENGVITKEKIYEMLNEEFSYLHGSGAYERNYALWTNGTEFWQDEFIYEYADARIDVLDEYFEKLCKEAAQKAGSNLGAE